AAPIDSTRAGWYKNRSLERNPNGEPKIMTLLDGFLRSDRRLQPPAGRALRLAGLVAVLALATFVMPAPSVRAAEPGAHSCGGEANLVLPDLNQAEFLGMGGRSLLMIGLVVCVAGLLFGLIEMSALK